MDAGIGVGVIIVIVVVAWYLGWLEPAETVANMANRELKKIDADSKVSYVNYMAQVSVDKAKVEKAKKAEELLSSIE